MERTETQILRNNRRVKYACYTSNLTMSIVGNLSPLLFLTFHAVYGISYTLLGTLVAINFITQLLIDFLFSLFSHKFNIQKTVRVMPILAVVGFLVYACSPFVFQGSTVYVGLVVGTMIFASASGLAEVLLSPIFAALPSDNPDRDMSKLHSIYAWGVVGVVIFVTLFLLFFPNHWYLLPLIFLVIPAVSGVLMFSASIPKMETPQKTSGALLLFKDKRLWLCIAAIFFGGAIECIMAQWASAYIEGALGIGKVWGDVIGVAGFALMLGLGRTLYAKFGKNICKVLLCCACGSLVCYITAAAAPIPMVCLAACCLTGLCASMLWPGSLVVASEKFTTSGVFIYAIMAAGGDLGAGLGPQFVGAIADGVASNEWFISLAQRLSITVEQLGLKVGMLCGALFALAAIFVFVAHLRSKSCAEKIAVQEEEKVASNA